MTYRKFRADYLFTGREMAGSDAVLVTTEDGTVQDLLPATEAGEGVEHLRGLLSPGFINCHCHLELSHMKGLLPERTGLVDFLLAVMRRRDSSPAAGGSPGDGGSTPVQAGGSSVLTGPGGSPVRGVNPAETAGFIREAIAAAELSMLNSGIVAVGDICNTTHTLAQKAEGRLHYHNFIETMGFIAHSAPDRFENSRKVFDAFGGGAAASLAPHAPYSVSPPLFELIAGFPGNRLLTIHNQESEAENEFYLTGQGDFLRLYGAMGLNTSFFTGTGKRSLESYLPYFRRSGGKTGQKDRMPIISPAKEDAAARSLILVHNVATNEEDLRFALGDPQGDGQRDLRLFFCLCPNANLYIGGKLPDVELLIRRNCVLVIGTDSLASNHQLSILEELKTLQQQFPQLSTPTLLKWATANGAEALGMEGMLGSFHPGKKPGLVLIEGLEGEKIAAAATARRVL